MSLVCVATTDRILRRLSLWAASRSPQLNRKVEKSHRTDQEEFYQFLTYTDDVDLNAKLREWEKFYNLSRLFNVKLSEAFPSQFRRTLSSYPQEPQVGVYHA